MCLGGCILVCIPALGFNKAELSCGSTALANEEQDSRVILPHVQDENQSDPSGAPSVLQVSPQLCSTAEFRLSE